MKFSLLGILSICAGIGVVPVLVVLVSLSGVACSCGSIPVGAVRWPGPSTPVPASMLQAIDALDVSIRNDETLLKTTSDKNLLETTRANLKKKKQDKLEKEADVEFYREHGYMPTHLH